MTTTALDTATTALDTAIQENRLIRHRWIAADEQGRKLVCLLAALSPEAGDAKNARACPASVMPLWLAHITPWIDDAGTEERWMPFVLRYAAVAKRWHVLDAEEWTRLEYQVRALAVREAALHISNDYTDAAKVRKVCETSAALCDRRAAGEAVSPAEWSAARSAARSAADAAESAAESAADAARSAAESAAALRADAARSAARSAADAAESAAESAADAARSAAESAAALRAARSAADNLIDKILCAIETATHTPHTESDT